MPTTREKLANACVQAQEIKTHHLELIENLPWATTGALALVSCAPARLLLKRWWAGANHRSDQREFIRVLGREERVSVIAEESSPRGAYNASTYVLHRCGGCRWMPPLERLLNASRAANGVDDASAADALAAVWETRVLFTGKL